MVIPAKIGRYEIIATLGQGAMGTVYKALDPVIERTVAIKTINLDLSKDELAEFEERFYREAKSAGRLNHASIVTIYDVGETGDMAYIAMEYLEGETLREMLDSGVVLPVERIGKIAARIANALNYAHENRVVHRDIKPANIMIAPNREVKIMDFGIAQIPMGGRTQVGTVLGSPKYMAPEQVAGKATDGRTDIFALGVVLYEMLTGTTPFNGDNLSAILNKILNEDPAPPSTVNARAPRVFDRIVARALAKRPEDRYQSAREFARDLRQHEALFTAESPRPVSPRPSRPAAQPLDDEAPSPDTTLVLTRTPQSRSPSQRAGSNSAQEAAASRKKTWPRRAAFLFGVAALSVLAFAMIAQNRPEETAHPPAPVAKTALNSGIDAPPVAVAPPKPADVAPPDEAAKAARKAAVAPAPAKAADKPMAAAEPEALPKASAHIAVAPWGEVFVDGESVGVSPPLTVLKLTPGRHVVEIRNQAFEPYRIVVNPAPGESLKIRHKFR